MRRRSSTGSPSAFARLLRGAGLDVPVGATLAFAEALGRGRARRAATGVYWAGRATLVRRPEDVDAYDRAFARSGGERAPTRSRWRRRRRVRSCSRSTPTATTTPTADDDGDGADAPDRSRCAAAAAEVLRHRDFAHVHARRVRRGAPADGRPAPRRRAAPLAAPAAPAGATGAGPTSAARSAARCAPAASRSSARSSSPPTRPRRRRAALRRERLDGAVRPGAGALPARRGRRPRPGRGVRARHPAHPHHPRALVAAIPTPRSPPRRGGSSTGRAAPASARACAQFNDEWGVRGMARGAVVVILSDGWDRGDPEVLAEQMARLAPGRVPDRVGEPAEGVARLRAARPGNGRGAAVRRRVRRGPLARVARGAGAR